MKCVVSGCTLNVFNKTNLLCRKHYRAQYRRNNLEKVKAQDKATRLRNIQSAKAYCNAYKRSEIGRYRTAHCEAKRRGLVMDITFDDFVMNLRAPCDYCEEIELTPTTGHRMDRIENSEGYCLANIVPCCPGCNLLRGDHLNYIEMKIAMSAVTKFRKELPTIPSSVILE